MFPHDKLDWTLSRLDRNLHGGQADLSTRLDFVKASLSRGRFHGGTGQDYNNALTHARRVLHQEPGHPEALALASLALVLLDRSEAAQRYLDEATQTASHLPFLPMTLAEIARHSGEEEQAIEQYSQVVRLAPQAWESHLLLGQYLAAQVDKSQRDTRFMERAMYHLVRSLQLGPSSEETPALLRDLAMLCLKTGHIGDAEALFSRLQGHEEFRAEARLNLGRVAYIAGKYKKAIMYFRQYLAERKDDSPTAWIRIGAAYLHLGEPVRAREACNRALAIDPSDLEARWILGSALVEEGAYEEAIRAFRELLEAAPDHQNAFAELVRLRTKERDVAWLRKALRTETAVFDRLPPQAWRHDGRHGTVREIRPRECTRARITTLIKALGRIDQSAVPFVLDCLDLTTDEGLRFQLWEGVLDLLAKRRSARVTEQLFTPGESFGSALGKEVLSLSHLLKEDALVAGLSVSEEDLRQAAVQRHGPAQDVVEHRQRVAHERQEARAWQAALLLSIAGHKSTAGRNLLVRWAADADPELSIAATTGLALSGDENAINRLKELAEPKHLGHLMAQVLKPRGSAGGVRTAVLVKERDDLTCATCGRRGSQVSHMLTNGKLSMCNICLNTISQRQEELATKDPQLACALTGATLLDTPALFVYQGVPVSSHCLDQSLGHEEREVIASFLASL